HVIAQNSLWTNVCKWPYSCIRADAAVMDFRTADCCTVADDTVDNMGIGRNDAVFSNFRIAVNCDVRMDNGVCSNFSLCTDVSSSRIDNGNSGSHVLFSNPFAHDAFSLAQCYTV